jgi:excisionase family DNA binding protein
MSMRNDAKASTRLDETVSVQRAAAILTVHEDTVLRLIAAGKLVAFKVGFRWRIHRSDLVEYRRAYSTQRAS